MLAGNRRLTVWWERVLHGNLCAPALPCLDGVATTDYGVQQGLMQFSEADAAWQRLRQWAEFLIKAGFALADEAPDRRRISFEPSRPRQERHEGRRSDTEREPRDEFSHWRKGSARTRVRSMLAADEAQRLACEREPVLIARCLERQPLFHEAAVTGIEATSDTSRFERLDARFRQLDDDVSRRRHHREDLPADLRRRRPETLLAAGSARDLPLSG